MVRKPAVRHQMTRLQTVRQRGNQTVINQGSQTVRQSDSISKFNIRQAGFYQPSFCRICRLKKLNFFPHNNKGWINLALHLKLGLQKPIWDQAGLQSARDTSCPTSSTSYGPLSPMVGRESWPRTFPLKSSHLLNMPAPVADGFWIAIYGNL